MNGRERSIKALTHEPVDRLPRDPWALPGISMFRQAELDALYKAYPPDVDGPGASYNFSKCPSVKGTPNIQGSYTDGWNCTFQVRQSGIIGEVKEPIFANDYEGLDSYQAPWEILEDMKERKSVIDRYCNDSDKFIKVGTEVRPFERMQFLRGTEDLYCDLALDEPAAYVLRDKLHEFFVEEMKFWASTAVDAIAFMDDWGSQRSLLINPEKWKSFYKPLYKEYCDIAHRAGKFVFFHSDGFIEDIYPELIEIGVDAVNSQLFCMDMEKLGREYGGKITFHGEIDRQYLLPFGKEEEVRAGVRRAFKALCPDGVLTGCFAQCEWGIHDPAENVFAVYDEWDRIAKEL